MLVARALRCDGPVLGVGRLRSAETTSLFSEGPLANHHSPGRLQGIGASVGWETLQPVRRTTSKALVGGLSCSTQAAEEVVLQACWIDGFIMASWRRAGWRHPAMAPVGSPEQRRSAPGRPDFARRPQVQGCGTAANRFSQSGFWPGRPPNGVLHGGPPLPPPSGGVRPPALA